MWPDESPSGPPTDSARGRRPRTVRFRADRSSAHPCTSRFSRLWHRGRVRILVVEDEESLADAIARGLRREGMAVDVALDGDSGHEKVTVTCYDVVVLDRDLPGM